MGLLKLKTKMSVSDYLKQEKISPVRHEYVEGVTNHISDANDNHVRIVGNINDKINVEVHRRRTDGSWITYFFDRDDTEVELASIELTLPLTEIYRRVKFDK